MNSSSKNKIDSKVIEFSPGCKRRFINAPVIGGEKTNHFPLRNRSRTSALNELLKEIDPIIEVTERDFCEDKEKIFTAKVFYRGLLLNSSIRCSYFMLSQKKKTFFNPKARVKTMLFEQIRKRIAISAQSNFERWVDNYLMYQIASKATYPKGVTIPSYAVRGWEPEVSRRYVPNI